MDGVVLRSIRRHGCIQEPNGDDGIVCAGHLMFCSGSDRDRQQGFEKSGILL